MRGSRSHHSPTDASLVALDGVPGRLPFTVRVAVVGSAELEPADRAAWRTALAGALRQLIVETQRQSTPETPISLTVVSSLAGDIPRMAVQVARGLGLTLEVVLSASGEDGRFPPSASARGEFNSLLSAASAVRVMAVGHEQLEDKLVELCDCVIRVSYPHSKRVDASSSRQRGSDLAESLGSRRKPHSEFHLIIGGEDSDQPLGDIPADALFDTDVFVATEGYNCESLPRQDYLNYLVLTVQQYPAAHQVFVVAAPYFGRADLLAFKWFRRFRVYSRWVAGLALLAVVMALTQLGLFPQQQALTWVEFASLFAVIVLVAVGRWRRWRSRWQSARYLAERIRGAATLAAVGISDPSCLRSQRRRSPEWIDRALREIWLKMPQILAGDDDIPQLRQVLVEWQTDQITYSRAMARRFAQRGKLLRIAAFVLFAAGFCVAAVHALLAHGSSEAGPDRLGYISVLIPIIGAAIAHQTGGANYGNRVEEFQDRAEELSEFREEAASATSLASLQECALKSEFTLRPQLRNLEELEIPM